MRKAALTFTLLPALCSCAFAAEQTFFSTVENASVQGPSPVISFGYIVQLIFSLLVVLGFIYVAAKYVFPKLKLSTKGAYINVIDRVVLEPQVTSYILKVGSSSYLIIVSSKSVTKIDKLEEDFEAIR